MMASVPSRSLASPASADPDQVLAGLDPEQREVALTLSGPVCVLAGAGTGKTRAITHRLAYGVACGAYRPAQVLALTFTARAAGEMRGRLAALGVGGVQTRTFHAAALRQLQFFWPQAVGGAPPPLVDHKAPLVGESAGRLRLRADRSAVRDLAAEIEWAKVNLLTPETYPAAAAKAGRAGAGGLDLTGVGRLIQVYEDVKAARGVIDFEDVLQVMVGILREYPQIATAVREQYRHFVVDEFQDVSALQHTLLASWLGERDEVCVVGDPSQTIYSFAGADPRYLLTFRTTYPNAKLLRLLRDYRSTPQVVGLANRLLDAAPAAARTARVELVAQRPPGPEPEVMQHPDDVAEAQAVVSRVATWRAAGTPLGEIAVLYRTNAQSQPLEAELASAGIAYQVRGSERFFARPEVRRAVMLLRGAARAGTSGELGAVVRDVLSAGGWSAEPPSSTGAVRDQWESLQALAVLADELTGATSGGLDGPPIEAAAALQPLEATGAAPEAAQGAPQPARPPTLTDFVAELEMRAAAAHAPSAGGVTLSSLHAAKGLEWDVVVIVGLSEGLMPISFAVTPEAIEEERRLLYVGVTRARHRLLLSWTASRTPGTRASRGPSRFLAPVSAKVRRVRAGVEPGEPKRQSGRRQRPSTLHTACRQCGVSLTAAAQRTIGRCATCPPDHDEAVFDALQQWRAERAQHDKVPAYVVFTDATLEAIAFSRPVSNAELLKISGVGAAKLERYGAEVLGIVTATKPTTGG